MENLLKIKDVAIMLNCSQLTVRRYIKQGKLKVLSFSRQNKKITAESLEEFIKNSKA